MVDIEIAVDGGTSKRLLTAGKYCDRNILVTATGGGGSPASVSPKDINFYDYDGTLVEAWTLEELAGKSALPANPTHDGLTAQGWNWPLEDLKSTNRAMNVGQMYVTDDGKTRLYLTIAAPGRQDVPLYISQTVANGVTIDWGDGSPAETLAGTGNVNTTHHYAEIGDYVITLDPADGCTLGLGHGSSSYDVLGSTGNNGRVYCNMLQRVEIGDRVTSIGSYAFAYCHSLASITIPDGVTSIGSYAFRSCYSLSSVAIPDGVTSIGSYAFAYCYSLASITIPDGVTSIGSYAFASCYPLASVTIPDGVTSIGGYAFQSCYSLSSITIPDGVTSIGSYAFQTCYSLSSITIPDSVTSIGSYAFAYCYSLASITIPDGVTSIGSYAFAYCYGVAEYHLLPTTPPALSTTNVFQDIPDDCIIYVPAGSLAAYQSATNWATYADQIQEEP